MGMYTMEHNYDINYHNLAKISIIKKAREL